MNRITKEERNRIYTHAEQLRRRGLSMAEIQDQLEQEGLSRQRARSAAARAIRVARHPRSK